MTERKAACHPEKRHHAKGLCYGCYLKAWAAAHPDKARSYRHVESDASHEKRKARKRRDFYMRQYGLTEAERAAIFSDQGGLCAICRKAPSEGKGSWNGKALHIDHDHEFDYVRGMLCSNCNRGLGCFQDSTDLLAAAGRYLLMAKAKHHRIRIAS